MASALWNSGNHEATVRHGVFAPRSRSGDQPLLLAMYTPRRITTPPMIFSTPRVSPKKTMPEATYDAPPCEPLQSEHQAKEQSPNRGCGEDEAGVGGRGQAEPEREGRLADGDPEAPQPGHRQQVFAAQLAPRLQDTEHAVHEEATGHEPKGHDRKRWQIQGRELGRRVVQAPEHGGED